MRKLRQHKSSLLTHLGQAIRFRREDMKLTQLQLATATKLHRTYITDIEAGRRNLSMLTYGKLTDALKCALSVPMINIERMMAREAGSALYGFQGGLSKASEALHSSSTFLRDLEVDWMQLEVLSGMSKLQLAVETFAVHHRRYPQDSTELKEAMCDRGLVNPFTGLVEYPTIGTAIDEEFTARTSGVLRPGEIEYSVIKNGSNYIIRGGCASGQALPGSTPGSSYVLSGNLRSDNQP